MKIRNTITKLASITMVVAAMAVIGAIGTAGRAGTTVRAAVQNNLKQILVFSPPMGFVHGETLRFSVYNPNAPERGSEPVRAQVKLYDAQGNVLARSIEVELPAGQFRSFDFNRDDLPTRGESGTGRQQVHAQVQFLFSDGSVRFSPERFPASMEIIDNGTGRTVSSISPYPTFTGGVSVAVGDVN